MREAIDWLLGLRTLRPGDEGVRFGFTYELTPWQWALIASLAVFVGTWCYRRIEGPRWWRGALGGARAGLIMLLAVLAAGPRLIRSNETVERDWLILLADRSGSMRIADVPGSGVNAPPISRDQQLAQILREHQTGLGAAQRGRVSLWLGFDSGAYELKPGPAASQPDAAATPTLNAPDGRRSDLAGAIESALARAAARPVSGIVFFTDGRATDTVGRATLRRLGAERIGLYPVALGSAEPLSDLSVRSVNGPGMAFVNDVVPVEAVLQRAGSTRSAAGARVQLIDTLTDKVLDERRVEFDPAPDTAAGDDARVRRVTLTGTPATAGGAQWRVRIVPDSPDLVAENNAASIAIDLVDRPLRVLYLDGYPRWEYRYLKNLFARERSMHYGAMLLTAGRRFLAEGSESQVTLPATAEQWNQYDVIVLGDLRPDVLTPEQHEQIKRRVLVGGAGLLWIGGEGATPSAWRGTALADLLPMTVGADGAPIRPWDQEVTVRPTPAAERLGVLRLLEQPSEGSWWPAAVSDPTSGWSRLRWAQRVERASLKPATEVLAEAEPINSGAESRSALVTTMRYGGGRIVYVATDEIWRWRYGRGEDLPERFWLQLVRLLGREAVGRAGKPAILTVTPARSEVGAPVRVSVELLDQRLLDAAPATVSVRLGRIGDLPAAGAARPTGPDTPTPGDAVELVLRPAGDASAAEGRRVFSGTWVPSQTGLYRATVSDALLAGDRVSTDAEIWLPDDELARPEADHALLASLARETGGRVLSPADLDRLDQILPRREVRLAGVPDEQTLWDAPLALILLVLLAGFEWAGRRLIRLA